MSNVNDLQAVADRLIKNTIKIAPTVELIEADKEIMREATTKSGEGITLSNKYGFVKTKKGSVASLVGQELVVNADRWALVPKEEQEKLLTLGLVEFKPKWSQNRKPSVEVGISA